MSLTKHETQVTWAAADSVSVAPGGSQESDIISLDATCVAARIQMKADNSGSPNSADQINFGVLETMGDPDGAGTDEFVTPGHVHPLGVLDTFKENPVLRANQFPLPQKSFKIYAEGIAGPTVNAITVSAIITELRSS